MTERERLERFIECIPKAELHVHLEGSMQPRTLLTLARRRGVELPADTEEGLRELFSFRDFEQFVEAYLLCSRCLRDPEDFQLLVEDFLAEQERQNVLYTEAYLTISTIAAFGANIGEVADALRETVSANEKRRGVHLRLIADIVRNVPRDRADQTLEWALEHRDDLVVALGLSGIESYPSEPFREHFEEAERVGLHRVAHAGEQTEAHDVRSALDVCHPERIGHGIRAVEDPAVLGELTASAVPLEISLTSNIRLGNCRSLEEHPIRALVETGIPVSINTDDPALFETNLNQEYLMAARCLDLDFAAVGELASAALQQSFIDDSGRDSLASEFRRRIDLAITEVGLGA